MYLQNVGIEAPQGTGGGGYRVERGITPGVAIVTKDPSEFSVIREIGSSPEVDIRSMKITESIGYVTIPQPVNVDALPDCARVLFAVAA